MSPAACTNRLAALRETIGNTPMLVIDYAYRGKHGTVCAKAEHMNLSGSIKDRMALHILEQAYSKGLLREGDTIAEATSGNTGISFAALGAALGHPVAIYMPDWMSRERRDLIRSYGAEVINVSKEEGGFLGSIDRCESRSRECKGTFLPRQFENEANVEAHFQRTGPEIMQQAETAGLQLDAFVAGVGTGGTVMGVSKYLRGCCPNIKLHPVEPAESPTLSTGHKVGSHRIQGISDEFIPAIVQLCDLDPVIAVHDGDSILMAQKLARSLGLAIGISSGCNFLAAVIAGTQQGSATPVVGTVFADDNKKYLSTALLGEEPIREGYLTPDIELLDMRVIARPN
ncbi:MAG: PLP-dependent cysteine synthase family protein [Acidobacteria bacterium]|nr:PLP-dependent cysteine synthase family protein [Acidobacteriota bacterium]